MDSETPLEDLAARYPQVAEELTEFALGLYHTSKYLMYHNDPSAQDGE